MSEAINVDLESGFANKAMLTIEDVCAILDCSPKVIYNWTKRTDPKKRPPRIIVGKSIRFPKTEFIRWLTEEQRAV